MDDKIKPLTQEIIQNIEEGDLVLSDQNKDFIYRCVKAGYNLGVRKNDLLELEDHSRQCKACGCNINYLDNYCSSCGQGFKWIPIII